MVLREESALDSRIASCHNLGVSDFIVSSPETSAEFDEYFELRWRVLRKFLDQPRGSERDEFDAPDKAAFHATVRDGVGRLLGVGRLHFISPVEAQIRYMAVVEDSRGSGVGSALVAELERIAADQSAQRVVLNAREAVVGFYRRLGYEVIGDGPTLFHDLKHVRMGKDVKGEGRGGRVEC